MALTNLSNIFAGNPLDRASLSRANPAFMAGLLANGRMVLEQ